MTWRYEQATGHLSRDGIYFTRGYAGAREGKNNPAMQTVPNVGPLPVGRYAMTAIMDLSDKGPRCIRLVQIEGPTFGRSGFLIHGDSMTHPGDASEGCIIVGGRTNRELIWGTKDRELEVVP
jgi:hypothetical protein